VIAAVGIVLALLEHIASVDRRFDVALSFMERVPPSNCLPGADLVEKGVRDLERPCESVESLLVSIGAPRLSRAGLTVRDPWPDPEQRLYELLRAAHGDAAHSRYNALVRRLVSFERAAATIELARA
jgi:hypothetical protein